MSDVARQQNLLPDPLESVRVGRALRPQELERHLGLKERVPGLVDGPCRPGTNLVL